MGEKAEPKISLPEAILIGIFLGVLDLIDLIPFAGDITDMFAAPLLFYYVIKHINGVAYAASLILDAIPVTQEFPTRSLVWWGTVIFDHFAPKQLSQAVEKTGELGEGEALEGGLAATEEEQITAQTEELGTSKRSNNQRTEGQRTNNGREDDGSGDQNGQEEESDGENDQNNDIMLGSEISPDEEAEQTDFNLPEDNLYNENHSK